jgi:hypothetical protein
VFGLGWSRPATGAFLGGYIILYGQVQANAEWVLKPLQQFDKQANIVPHKWHVVLWALLCVPSLAWLGGFVQWSSAFECVAALDPSAAPPVVRNATAAAATAGESKRLVVESPWSQLTSECQRF